MKLASGIAPVVKLLKTGIPVGLGTDGPAGSNNDFDLMEEMNLAADLQKVATLEPTVIPAPQAIEMATILGAKVAGLDKEIGSLEPGKRADFIVIDRDIFAIDPFTLHDTRVDLTYLDGREVYPAPQ